MFFPFSRTIFDSGKFIPSRSEAEKLAGADKKFFFWLSTSFQVYLPFIYGQDLD